MFHNIDPVISLLTISVHALNFLEWEESRPSLWFFVSVALKISEQEAFGATS